MLTDDCEDKEVGWRFRQGVCVGVGVGISCLRNWSNAAKAMLSYQKKWVRFFLAVSSGRRGMACWTSAFEGARATKMLF